MNWTIYELLINLFQGFLYTWFITKVLTPSKKYKLYWYIVCSLLTAGSLSTYIFFDMPEWDTWTIVFIICYSIIFFSDSLSKKIFWDMILAVISMGIPGIWYQAAHVFLDVDVDMLLLQNLPRIIFTLSGNVVLFAAFFITAKLFKNTAKNGDPSFFLLISDILCALLIDVFFRLYNEYQISSFWLFVGSLVSLIIAIVTLIMHRVITGYVRKEQEYLYREKFLKETNVQTENIKTMYDSMLKLRHDMNAYIKDINEMIAEGSLPKTPEYFEQMSLLLTPLYNTGNITLDSVLSVKNEKMKKLGIEFRAVNLHYTGGMNISDTELCSLVSNMLDNACEALEKRKEIPGEHYIYLQFSYTAGGLMIICENPLLGMIPKTAKQLFSSSKKEPYHGLGISIMEKIVSNAGGQFDIVSTDELFRLLILIPPVEDQNTLRKP